MTPPQLIRNAKGQLQMSGGQKYDKSRAIKLTLTHTHRDQLSQLAQAKGVSDTEYTRLIVQEVIDVLLAPGPSPERNMEILLDALTNGDNPLVLVHGVHCPG